MGSGLPFTSFLSEGTRQSLLGPAPIPQVGLFASGPNHSLTHFLNKDICVRKRKKEQTGSAGGQLSSSSAEGLGERDDRTPNTKMQEAESVGQFFAKQQEPEMKKQKMNGSEEPVNIKIGQEAVQKSDNEMSTDVPQPVDISALEYRGGSTSIQVAEECCKESITAEVACSGGRHIPESHHPAEQREPGVQHRPRGVGCSNSHGDPLWCRGTG